MEEGWISDGDGDGDDLLSPKAKLASRLALPRKNRGWRRLRDGFWKSGFCLEFPITGINRSQSRAPGEGESPRRHVGAAPPLAAPAGRLGAPGCPLAPLLAPGSFGCVHFFGIFLGIF